MHRRRATLEMNEVGDICMAPFAPVLLEESWEAADIKAECEKRHITVTELSVSATLAALCPLLCLLPLTLRTLTCI